MPRLVAGQKHIARHDIRYLGQAPQRNGGADLVQDLGGNVLQNGRQRGARCHAVDGDTPRTQLQGRGPRKGQDAALGGGVSGKARCALVGQLGRRVDDAARTAGIHFRQNRFRDQEGSAQVDGNDTVPDGRFQFMHSTGCRNAGVVHQNIDTPEGRMRCCDHGGHLGFITDVCLNHQRTAPQRLDFGGHRRRRRGLGGARVVDNNIGALAGESQRNTAADPRTAASHQSNASNQLHGASRIAPRRRGARRILAYF